MQNRSFEDTVNTICETDSRYDPDAYFFLREALDVVTKDTAIIEKRRVHHISGRELLEGLRAYCLQEFGPMTLTLLNSWGIKQTEDIGNIVFNLVGAGKLGKTEEDNIEDFADGFDFTEAFSKPFEPEHKKSSPPVKKRAKKRN